MPGDPVIGEIDRLVPRGGVFRGPLEQARERQRDHKIRILILDLEIIVGVRFAPDIDLHEVIFN